MPTWRFHHVSRSVTYPSILRHTVRCRHRDCVTETCVNDNSPRSQHVLAMSFNSQPLSSHSTYDNSPRSQHMFAMSLNSQPLSSYSTSYEDSITCVLAEIITVSLHISLHTGTTRKLLLYVLETYFRIYVIYALNKYIVNCVIVYSKSSNIEEHEVVIISVKHIQK